MADRGSEAAYSKKTANDVGGHSVTTVATHNDATAGIPFISVEVPPSKKAGFTWDDGGWITKITPKGLADRAKVLKGWRLVSVNGIEVSANVCKSGILKVLTNSR